MMDWNGDKNPAWKLGQLTFWVNMVVIAYLVLSIVLVVKKRTIRQKVSLARHLARSPPSTRSATESLLNYILVCN